MEKPAHIARLEAIFEQTVSGWQVLGRTWGLDVLKVDFAAGPPVLAKVGAPELPGHLEIEAFMLRELKVRSDLPVPGVLQCEPAMLVMEWIDNDGPPHTPAHERHAAELLAALHGHSSTLFGYGRNTVIGGLIQQNAEAENWVEFFAQRRLLYMARIAMGEGALEPGEFSRLEALAGRLERYLEEPEKPSLLHGDLWQGNILVKGDQIAAMIDPAISFGHREIELAFTTMFGTFGPAFFDAYGAIYPVDKAFFEIRKDIYNLYPSLVHAALFGRSYVPAIVRVLDRLGV